MGGKETNYLMQLLPDQDDGLAELEKEASANNIPIMDPLGMKFVAHLIRLIKPARILEIGTAIGYSALRMAEAYPETEIVTLEKDPDHFEEAKQNIYNRNKQNQIYILYGDASNQLEMLPADNFDVVLIDAAKGQYQNYFELSRPLLKSEGVIISDNVLFKGYVADTEKEHPRFQAIAEKMRKFNQWLVEQPDFITTFVPIGDGIAISSQNG